MIIGRKKEQFWLGRAYSSTESQFITVYGRRRVGKTYLIREFFKGKPVHYVHVTGAQHGTLDEQLENFVAAVSKAFKGGSPLRMPRNWREAFEMLEREMEKVKGKIVLFFDELPWLVTPKSGLMSLIDFYWNNRWAGTNNMIFIACGSSASWLLKNIIYNRGGLHNRTTLEINLLPFNLMETKEFLESKKVKLTEQHILSLYMAVGGIPYYLDYVIPGTTTQQNIQQLFFDFNAPLRDEFRKLFDSLFDGADAYKELIRLIAKNKEGLSRGELVSSAKHSETGGLLTKRLAELCEAGFLKKYLPWGKTVGVYYQVIDEFCLFYLHWVEGHSGHSFDADHWVIQSQRPGYYAWAGYAFEAVCAKHIHNIIRGLGIKTVNAIAAWRYVPKSRNERGAQIDLVIDRIDNAITLCEMKYTSQPFAIDKEYAAVLTNKIEIFRKRTKTTKQLFLTMVSANGLKETIYSEELVSGFVTLEVLFKYYA